jgi:hypothetical protein
MAVHKENLGIGISWPHIQFGFLVGQTFFSEREEMVL